MNAEQVKSSVEMVKEVMADKALKTKAEKDRRIREKKQMATKKMLDERKNATIKQGREKEKLKVTHDKETANFDKDFEAVSLFFCIFEN